MTAVQPPAMTRQSLPLNSYLPSVAGADCDTHRLSSSVISPLSLPGPVRPFQFSQTHLLASAQGLNRHARSGISSMYRSVSASPTSSRKPAPAPANGRPVPVGPPSASTTTSSSATTDSDQRARVSMMEVERTTWEAEKAGFKRHIEVLEEKLRTVVLEKEELQDTVTRLEHLIMEHQDIGHLQTDISGLIHRSRSPDRTPRFVHYSIPGPTTLTATELSHIETQIDATKSPGGTTTAQANISTSVYHHTDAQGSAQQPSESPNIETIDVSDINPSLEGIRLKSAAVQRSTFSDTKSPPLLSSESSSLSIPATQVATSQPEQNIAVPKSSKAQTLHALATDVAGRRRMHAGHTPSHSVAHFPIPVAVEVAEAALGAAQGVAAELAVETRKCSDASEGEAPVIGELKPQVEEVIIEEEAGKEETAELPLDPPASDQPLTGPLMAQSDGSPDAFLDEFTKKLEDISSGAEDSVPSVLKRSPMKEVEADVVGGATEEPEVEPEDTVMDEEVDIPLKLKATTNFGLPWGSLNPIGSCAPEWNRS